MSFYQQTTSTTPQGKMSGGYYNSASDSVNGGGGGGTNGGINTNNNGGFGNNTSPPLSYSQQQQQQYSQQQQQQYQQQQQHPQQHPQQTNQTPANPSQWATTAATAFLSNGRSNEAMLDMGANLASGFANSTAAKFMPGAQGIWGSLKVREEDEMCFCLFAVHGWVMLVIVVRREDDQNRVYILGQYCNIFQAVFFGRVA
jgi:hypothetical protein